MQSVLLRMWTHVAMSISYNDNQYTTGTSVSLVLMPDNSSFDKKTNKQKNNQLT